MSFFAQLPLMGILRGISPEMVGPIAEIASRSGLEALEVTMNTAGAPELIRALTIASAGRFRVGAGTVLGMRQLETAVHAGASFIVSPIVDTVLIKECVSARIPVFPGALTPTEVWQAWDSGATMVKLFPANSFGPGYVKDLLGPLDQVKIMICGGVSPANISEYFANGAAAAAFGGSIFNLEQMKKSSYSDVTSSLNALIKAVRK